jgi:hypothetical protein
MEHKGLFVQLVWEKMNQRDHQVDNMDMHLIQSGYRASRFLWDQIRKGTREFGNDLVQIRSKHGRQQKCAWMIMRHGCGNVTAALLKTVTNRS